jgi:hypothetical protein
MPEYLAADSFACYQGRFSRGFGMASATARLMVAYTRFPFHFTGFNVETVEYKNISFTVWDVGGQDKVRNSSQEESHHPTLLLLLLFNTISNFLLFYLP